MRANHPLLALACLLPLAGCTSHDREPPAPPAAAAPMTKAPEPPTSAPGSAQPQVEKATHVYAYQCGDLAVTGKFSVERVELSFAGRTLVLPHALSGSGARYADDKGNEFWGKGLTDAMFTQSGEKMRLCKGDGKELGD
ncbi:MliC family protein [Dyella soli]|nr:MliC family protein [Dyella soli]